eukprot:1142272-Rhodomonas_salina.5
MSEADSKGALLTVSFFHSVFIAFCAIGTDKNATYVQASSLIRPPKNLRNQRLLNPRGCCACHEVPQSVRPGLTLKFGRLDRAFLQQIDQIVGSFA